MKVTPEKAAQIILQRKKARSHIKEFAKFMEYEGNLPALHHEYLLDQIEEVLDGVRDRLMVFMPPGSAKSTYCSVLTPAYYMGKYPDKRVISASYDTDFATQFGGKVRNMITYNDRYVALFPGMELSQDTKAKGQWNLRDHLGGYFATGVGSAVTGRRANLAILDDIVKGREEADSARIMGKTWEWLFADLLTRLLPDGKIILIMTRWSQNDPAGRLLPDDWRGESGDIKCTDGKVWRVVCIPAQAVHDDPIGRKPGEYLWTDFYSEDWWEGTKQAQNLKGTRNWDSLYQQVPTPEEGTYFKREWFKWYTPETQPKRLNFFMAGDFAVSQDRGDFTEIGVFGVDSDDNLYVAPDLGWWSGQSTADIWIDRLLDFVKFFKPFDFISEKGVIRNAIEPYLDKRMDERRTYVVKQWLSHIGDKASNARAFQARASVGKVYLPDNDIGHRILRQLLEFPAGRNDDIVDVCGLMGRWLQMSTVPTSEVKRIVVPDRWERAFSKLDSKSDNTWRTA